MVSNYSRAVSRSRPVANPRNFKVRRDVGSAVGASTRGAQSYILIAVDRSVIGVGNFCPPVLKVKPSAGL